MSTNPVVRKIIQAAQLFDLPPEWMVAMAHVESGLNPFAENKGSGAKGLFQFIPSTAQEYNISPLNVPESCSAACMMASRNHQRLAAHGHGDNLTLVYLAHQQGLSGILNILSVLSDTAVITPGRFRNIRSNLAPGTKLSPSMTDKEVVTAFLAGWTARLQRALKTAIEDVQEEV